MDSLLDSAPRLRPHSAEEVAGRLPSIYTISIPTRKADRRVPAIVDDLPRTTRPDALLPVFDDDMALPAMASHPSAEFAGDNERDRGTGSPAVPAVALVAAVTVRQWPDKIILMPMAVGQQFSFRADDDGHGDFHISEVTSSADPTVHVQSGEGAAGVYPAECSSVVVSQEDPTTFGDPPIDLDVRDASPRLREKLRSLFKRFNREFCLATNVERFVSEHPDSISGGAPLLTYHGVDGLATALTAAGGVSTTAVMLGRAGSGKSQVGLHLARRQCVPNGYTST